jgi:hypothetical protein
MILIISTAARKLPVYGSFDQLGVLEGVKTCLDLSKEDNVRWVEEAEIEVELQTCSEVV